MGLPVLILYGSQTGAAKSIAEVGNVQEQWRHTHSFRLQVDEMQSLHGEARVQGFQSNIGSLNEYMSCNFLEAPVVIIVCSTTGNGDPPNNAEEFWRFVRKRTHPKDLLARTRFALLGLGDTNYDKFCGAAKAIQKRLLELGAHEFFHAGFADEAMGLETTVEPWTRGLWPQLKDVTDTEKPADTIAAKSSAADVPPTDGIAALAITAPVVKIEPPHATAHSPMSLLHELAAQKARTEAANHLHAHTRTSSALATSVDAPRPSEIPQKTSTHPQITSSTTTAAASVVSSASVLTPGVLSFQELFPHLLVGSSDSAVPAFDSPNATKGLPKLPPVTLDVEVVLPSASEVGKTALNLHAQQASVLQGFAAANAPTVVTSSSSSADYSGNSVAGKALEHPALVRVCNAKYLTTGGSASARRVVLLECDVSNTGLSGAWNPGDSVGVVAPNAPSLCAQLCEKLGYPPDTKVTLAPKAAEAGSSGCCVIPTWLKGKQGGSVTLFDAFSWCLDVCSTPKKTFVRMLAEYATGRDRDILTYLCGRSGKDAFTTFFEDQRLNLLEILQLFPTCKPPLAHLLSTLPSLPPRYYSIACSPLAHPNLLTVAFTVVEYECAAKRGVTSSTTDVSTPMELPPPAAPIKRSGLATSWLEQLCQPFLSGSVRPKYPDNPLATHSEPRKSISLLFPTSMLESPVSSLEPSTASMVGMPMDDAAPTPSSAHVTVQLEKAPPLPPVFAEDSSAAQPPASDCSLLMFLRPTRDFSLPASVDKPVIMIGPGTGVAPFVGFLQHRHCKLERDAHSAVAVCKGAWRPGCYITSLTEDREFYTPLVLGPAYLFFGNRRSDLDFLFQDVLKQFVEEGVLTRLYTAFSREGPEKVYVQHRIREVGALLADLVLQRGAYIYVCGDGANMAKDVHNTLVEVLQAHGKSDGASIDANELLQSLAKKGRYVRDIWS